MTKLKHQQITNAKAKKDMESLQAISNMSGFNDSPALAALEAKLLRRRKRDMPRTYRRPDYLRYIDYA